jgi:hypothetical protein
VHDFKTCVPKPLYVYRHVELLSRKIRIYASQLCFSLLALVLLYRKGCMGAISLNYCENGRLGGFAKVKNGWLSLVFRDILGLTVLIMGDIDSERRCYERHC